VCEQLAQRNLQAARVFFGVRNEFGHDAAYRRIKIEQAALVETHCHGGSRDYFSDGTKIEKRSRCDGWRVRFVSALAEGSQCDQSRLKCHSHRSRRKNPLRNGFLQDAKGGNENFVLMLKSVLQRRAWLGAVQCGDAFWRRVLLCLGL